MRAKGCGFGIAAARRRAMAEPDSQPAADGRIDLRLEDRPQGIVAHVTIDRARQLNAMGGALMAQFVETMARLGGEERLRAVVLSGAGDRAFIGGADIREMARLTDAAEARGFIMRVHQCCDAIRACPVPVIARIRGHALGAGLEIAAACDLRVAAEDAVFGMPEVRLGIPSVVEAALLPLLIGWGRARELLLLGGTIDAAQAAAWGLVERVAPATALDGAVEAWLGMLLLCPPGAIRLQKRLMRQWEELPLKAAVEAGIDAFAAAYATDEPGTAMGRFLAERSAQKKGG
jgi:enoyl-CoA hydratase/carnithine racemase